MRFPRLAPALLALLVGLAGSTARAADPAVSASDEAALKAAGLKADGTVLLDFFKKRSAAKPDKEELAALVKNLGDKDAAKRDKAVGELVSLGQTAVPALRHAANELNNAEAAALARKTLQQIEGSSGAAVTAAAVRALAGLKPAGTAEALIAYLPTAEDDQVLEDVSATLVAVAVNKGGKADPALVKALADDVPIRRAVAAEVLAQAGGEGQRPAVRKLLKDPKPTVRLRAALALSQFQDAEAVPVLIGLLSESSPAQSRQIEDFLTNLAGEWAVAVPQGNDAVARKLRRELWAAWWAATDGPALLDELKKRTPTDAEREKVLALVAKLGDKDATVRDKAVTDLVALGAPAVPFLRQAVGGSDTKVAEAAQKALGLTDQTSSPPLPAVAAKLLALRRPDGAAEVILAYLPSAEDDTIAGDLRTTLAAVALKGGKADPALVKALEDKLPLRRAAAAEALAFGGGEAQREAVRKLLKDEDPAVRIRVAVALTSTQDKDTIPTLISFLTELPVAQASQAEEQLRFLAANTSPPDVALGDTDATRKKAKEAWDSWWRKNAEKIQLARLDNRDQLLGYTVVTEMYDPAKRGGRIVELDRSGKARWELTLPGNPGPSSAQVLPGDHVLVSEVNMNRVVELDLKGKEIWSRPVNQPTSAHRFKNGNTLLIGRGQIVEIDKAGKELLNINRNNFYDIVSAVKMKNGDLVYITQQGHVTRTDKEGKKTLKEFNTAGGIYYLSHFDALPNDHVVVPVYNANKVIEYDANGKEVWSAAVTWPVSAKRLPNGNTLVASINPGKVVELDKAGKVVWESKETFRQPMHADRR